MQIQAQTSDTTNAVIYTTPDGTSIIFPKEYDKTHQTMTPEKAIELYGKVPVQLRKLGQRKIVFHDMYNPYDNYWRSVYKNFTNSYATGGDVIDFWRYDFPHNDYYVVRTYCHEIAHKIDIDRGITVPGGAWEQAIQSDMLFSRKKSVTDYGENSPIEDFAESVAEYVNDVNAFKKLFPERAKILKSILEY